MTTKTRVLLCGILAALCSADTGWSSERVSGAKDLEGFVALIRKAFQTHKLDILKGLHHPTTPKEIVQTELEVIRGAVGLEFDEYKTTRINVGELPLELPSALPDGRRLRHLHKPDGVIVLAVKSGQGASALKFRFYFPYKILKSRCYLCPTGFE